MIFWDRPTLKMRAKQVLRRSYWMSFAATLILNVLIFGGAITGRFGGFRFNYNVTYNTDYPSFPIDQIDPDFFAKSILMGLAFLLVMTVITMVITFVYLAFVGNIMVIGKARYFTLCRYDTINLNELFWGFRNRKYLSNVKTMFLRSLYQCLWTLLFYVPGIVKYYSYWMIPYLLAENPNLTTKRAFEISMQTTKGEKWNMFVLDLSFLGWMLLCLLTCGIGYLFLEPYMEATKAELYGALRFKAIRTGIADRSEIGAEL